MSRHAEVHPARVVTEGDERMKPTLSLVAPRLRNGGEGWTTAVWRVAATAMGDQAVGMSGAVGQWDVGCRGAGVEHVGGLKHAQHLDEH